MDERGGITFVMKRFTETDKWRDSWFADLTTTEKLAYIYIMDTCDVAGVWDANIKLANFSLGVKVDWDALFVKMGKRAHKLTDGKLFLTRFVAFQYGKLSTDCRPHYPIFRLIEKHQAAGYPPNPDNLDTLPDTLSDNQQGTLQDKDKTKTIQYKDKTIQDKEPGVEPPPEFVKPNPKARSAGLFAKRPSTVWDRAEVTAWGKAEPAVVGTSEADWLLLERFYTAKDSKEFPLYRRQNLSTLLNNWNGEIEKARKWAGEEAKVEDFAKYQEVK